MLSFYFFFFFRFSPLHPSKYPFPNFLEQAKSALVEHQHTIAWNEIPNQLESLGRVSLFPCCNKSKKIFLFFFFENFYFFFSFFFFERTFDTFIIFLFLLFVNIIYQEIVWSNGLHFFISVVHRVVVMMMCRCEREREREREG